MRGVRAGGVGNTFQVGTDTTRNARSLYHLPRSPSRRRCFPIPTDTPGGTRRRGSRRRSAVPGRAGMAHGGAVWAARGLGPTRGFRGRSRATVHSGSGWLSPWRGGSGPVPGRPRARPAGRRSCRPCGLVHPGSGGPGPSPASRAAFPPGRDVLAGRRPGARPGPGATGREGATWVERSPLGGRCQGARG